MKNTKTSIFKGRTEKRIRIFNRSTIFSRIVWDGKEQIIIFNECFQGTHNYLEMNDDILYCSIISMLKKINEIR